MKATVLQENLARALGIVGRAVKSNSTLPVLANVLISAESGKLRFAATNLEIGITCLVDAQIEKEGAITVPAKTIADLVGTLAKEDVVLTLDETAQAHDHSGSLDAANTDCFARRGPGVSRVLITENEINFLAFPPLEGSLVVFGAGYGFDTLAQAAWLRRCAVHYWGDIDTHGFAILDQLRTVVPHAESFLMDRETLMAHVPHWVEEPRPLHRDLTRLRPEEQALYDDLRNDRLRPALRLEQERIGFGRVEQAVATLATAAPRHRP